MLAGEGTFTEYDLDDAGALVPVDRPQGRNKAAIVAGVVSTPTTLVPEGIDAGGAAGRPDEGARRAVGAGVRAGDRRARPGRAACGCRWSGSRSSAGARISMDSGTENMDWVAAALQADRRVHPGGRRDQHRRRRHQRGRAAVLERRGHDAHAHQGHPGDDAGLGDGAHRQAALDFSGGVSAEDNFGIGGYDRVMGPNGQAQYWAPNLARGARLLMAHYDHTYVVPGESSPRQAGHLRPGGPRRVRLPARHRGQRLHHGGPDLLGRAQPGPEEAVRHPHRDARAVRPGPPGAGALGRHGRRGHGGRAGRAPRRPPGVPARHRVPFGAAARLPAHRRPGHLHGRHAVPALVQEGRPRDQRRQRQPAAGGAGQPVGLRRIAGVDAQAAAGVRRRDRPRRSSTSTARSCSA